MGARSGGGGTGFGSRAVRYGDASMRHLSAAAQKAAKEEAIRHKTVEHGVVMDEKGNVIWKGTQYVPRRVRYGADRTNRITIHNHPGGSSFSKKDLMNAANYNQLESRVVTEKYTYSIRRPKDGWRTGGWQNGKFYNTNSDAYKIATQRVARYIKSYVETTKKGGEYSKTSCACCL